MSTLRNPMAARLAVTLFLALALAAGPDHAQAAADGDEATAVVMRLQAGLLRLDKETTQRNNLQRSGVFAPLIESTHDLDYMARIALSRFWGAFSPEQRHRFEVAFRKLSIMGYAARFRDTEGSTFAVDQVRVVPGGRVEVATHLMVPSEAPVSLNYVLHKGKDGWQIINILAEGVSDLALQRSQYQQVMQSKGFDELLVHLAKKADDLETGQK